MPRKTKRVQRPKAGDEVLVEWADIYEQPTEDMAQANVKRFRSLTYFVGWKGRGKMRHLVTTNCYDIDTGEAYGCCSYPAGCVLSVTKIDRTNK